jgi:hypothetical protein
MMVQPRHDLCLPLACPSSPSPRARLNCPWPFPSSVYTALLCPVSLYLCLPACLPACLERRFFGRRKDPSQPPCPYISYDSRPIWQRDHIAVASPLHSHSQAKVRVLGDEGRGGRGRSRRRGGRDGAVRGVQAAAAAVRGGVCLRALLPARGAAQVCQRAQGVRRQQCQQAAPGKRASFLLLVPPALPRLGCRSGTLFLLCLRVFQSLDCLASQVQRYGALPGKATLFLTFFPPVITRVLCSPLLPVQARRCCFHGSL